MKKLILIIFSIIFCAKVYSQEDCKVCLYFYNSQFDLFDSNTSTNINYDETCSNTISAITWWGGNRTFTLTGVDDSGCNPLPVELIYFKGVYTSGRVVLEWSTASENNSDYFVIYKSVVIGQWEELDRVKAAGNSININNYKLIDDEIQDSVVYYKLKQVDFNGDYKEYNIILVNIPKKKLVKIINLEGKEVNKRAKGPLIYIYSDGTRKQIYKD